MKDGKLEVRLTNQERALIEQAVSSSGLSMNDILRLPGLDYARILIRHDGEVFFTAKIMGFAMDNQLVVYRRQK